MLINNVVLFSAAKVRNFRDMTKKKNQKITFYLAF